MRADPCDGKATGAGLTSCDGRFPVERADVDDATNHPEVAATSDAQTASAVGQSLANCDPRRCRV